MSTACWSDRLRNLGFKSRTPATGCACDGVNFVSSVIREGDRALALLNLAEEVGRARVRVIRLQTEFWAGAVGSGRSGQGEGANFGRVQGTREYWVLVGKARADGER